MKRCSMAKKRTRRRGPRENSKAQAIRDQFASLGAKARPKDVIAALKAKGIVVSSAQVSNIKASQRKGKSRGKAARAADGTFTLEALVDAKKLADRLGGVEAARELLDALSRLS